MQLQHITLCAAALSASAAAPFTQADSLKQLPAAVRQQLGQGKRDDPIADRGEPFNPGCVVRDSTPRKRFLLGAQHGDVVVAAVEYGGIAHHAEAITFVREGGGWKRSASVPLAIFPRTAAELLAVLKLAPPVPATAPVYTALAATS